MGVDSEDEYLTYSITPVMIVRIVVCCIPKRKEGEGDGRMVERGHALPNQENCERHG